MRSARIQGDRVTTSRARARASAFDDDLTALDELATLPIPLTAHAVLQQAGTESNLKDLIDMADHESATLGEEARQRNITPSSTLARPADGRHIDDRAQVKADRTTTRATQVRLPAELAGWLTEQASVRGITYGSVIASGVISHRNQMVVESPSVDGLVVQTRQARHYLPVTLRLTRAQRELLDGIAAEMGATRTAVVIAALTAAGQQ